MLMKVSAMNELPKLLYRGDSDKMNKREIRATLNYPILKTGLSDGGNGREIFLNPLQSLVHRHVAPGWDKTHFLSFTTDKGKALVYGGGEGEHYPISSDDKWDFVLFTLDTGKFIPDSIKQLETGVYQVEYYPHSREFLPTYRILLIDVVTFLHKVKLSGSDDYSESIFKAERDKEWLVYPATPMRDSNENTSKFDTGCIIEKQAYKTYR